MADAEIGGDTSVEWKIKADHIRESQPPTSKPDAVERRRWRQHGIDETDFGEKSGFFITLKMPKDASERRTFVTTLCRACADAQANIDNPGSRVHITLPIERKSPNQILISWKSKKLPNTKRGRKGTPKSR